MMTQNTQLIDSNTDEDYDFEDDKPQQAGTVKKEYSRKTRQH